MIYNKQMINQMVEAILTEIIETIQKYQECPHEIVTDYIDIDPDRGMAIKYCVYCEQTFL